MCISPAKFKLFHLFTTNGKKKAVPYIWNDRKISLEADIRSSICHHIQMDVMISKWKWTFGWSFKIGYVLFRFLSIFRHSPLIPFHWEYLRSHKIILAFRSILGISATELIRNFEQINLCPLSFLYSCENKSKKQQPGQQKKKTTVVRETEDKEEEKWNEEKRPYSQHRRHFMYSRKENATTLSYIAK